MSVDILLLLLIVLLLLISVASLIDWLRERRQKPPIVSWQLLERLLERLWQQRSRLLPSQPVVPEKPLSSSPEVSKRSHSRLSDLNRRLLTVLGGNGDIAQRLLEHSRQKFPNRDLVWYYEKVLDDLERDRRS
ncbi:MAG: hypothetical protein NZ772_14890 [Cyanobacteria bacterium]|nr:hypothetical protein [Cyanobacteriota bacterium]MDW8202405.1 hypothetical protein [Cyanobacteriota bacterium SKYGB_h_bin112]